VDGVIAEGVPLMTPLEVLKLRPDGKAGLMDQVTTAPPLFVGVSGEMATFWVKLNAPAP
jgi:hypothetical protein